MCGGGGGTPSYQKVEPPAQPAPAAPAPDLEIASKKDDAASAALKAKKGKRAFRVDLKDSSLGTGGMSGAGIHIPTA